MKLTAGFCAISGLLSQLTLPPATELEVTKAWEDPT